MSAFPDALLQRYRIDKPLDKGEFGQVYLATRLRTGSPRAIKVIGKRENWEREVDVLTLLRHPNIVRYYDHVEDEYRVYVIMEYCPGGNLYDELKRCGCLDEARAQRLGAQLLGALEYCQGHLVAHRDLKPENLLLDADDNLKLADFGLAKQTQGSTGTMVGSLWYAAMELFEGSDYNPMLSDAWSFGVVLCTIVLGRFPFLVSNEQELRRQLWQRKIPQLATKTTKGVESSATFQMLVSQLLVPAAQRLPLHHCKYALWFQGHHVANGLQPREPCEPDAAIVQVIVDMGYAKQAIEHAVRKNKPCPAHSIYHLLSERQRFKRADSMPELLEKTQRHSGAKPQPQRVAREQRSSSLDRSHKKPNTPIESPPPIVRKLRRWKITE